MTFVGGWAWVGVEDLNVMTQPFWPALFMKHFNFM